MPVLSKEPYYNVKRALLLGLHPRGCRESHGSATQYRYMSYISICRYISVYSVAAKIRVLYLPTYEEEDTCVSYEEEHTYVLYLPTDIYLNPPPP